MEAATHRSPAGPADITTAEIRRRLADPPRGPVNVMPREAFA